MRVIARLLVGTIVAATVARADPVIVTVDARRASDPVTKYEYGMFIEPIGGLIARTLWAEMLDDRKFYYPIVTAGKDPPSPQSVEGRPGVTYRKWRPVGGDDAVVMDTRDPYVGAHSPSVGAEGTTPRGFGQAGIGVVNGKTYKGHIVLNGDAGVRVQVALIWGTGPDDRQSVTVEPYVTVNAGLGDANSAAEEVEYLNGSSTSEWGAKRATNGHPAPYGVKFWNIGNEPYGWWQIGRTTLTAPPISTSIYEFPVAHTQ